MRDFTECVGRVYRFTLRLTHDRHAAEDITQETMLRAWRHRRRLRDPRSMGFYLCRIAANVFRDQLRRARSPVGRAGPLVESDGEGLERARRPAERSPELAFSEREQVEAVMRAMDGLPPRQRQVLYLHAFEDLSPGEIARVLGISRGGVKASLSLARRALRRRVGAAMAFEDRR